MSIKKINRSLRQLFDLPVTVAQKYRSDRLGRHAAALSFSSLLALAPMMAIVFSVLSMFSGFTQFGDEIEKFVFQFLLPTTSGEVQTYLQQFADQAGKLTLIGLGFFLLTALLLLFTIEESFNDIWGVKRGRRLSSRITVYWALLSLGPILMGASLTISTYLLGLTVSESLGMASQVQSWGVTVLPFVFEALAFLLLYMVMPNVRVTFLHGLVGAIVAAILFELTKQLFSLYVLNFNSYQVVYGALSTLPVLLIWIYVSWMVALIGAEVVSVLQQKKLLLLEREKKQRNELEN